MPITELIFPAYKLDPQSIAAVKGKQPEMIQAFTGVEGLKAVFLGSILEENGAAVDPKAMRALAVLEWSAPSFFHAFYPSSQKFESFVNLVKPYLAAPPAPQLYEAEGWSTSCSSSNITQIIKAKSGKTTEEAWAKLVGSLEGSLPDKPLSHFTNGIEKDDGVFLGVIGWSSWQDYERVGKDNTFLDNVKGLEKGDEFQNIVAELKRVV